MEATEKKNGSGPFMKVIEFLSGFGLACVLLILMGILTWLGTLEQTDHSLHDTINKYFSHKTFFLVPEINGKTVPIPLPSAYWVGGLFFINLLLGTILRVRKGWKQAGILISHFGMLFLLVSGFVTQHTSTHANLAVWEGEISDVAERFYNEVIEVAEIEDGKVAKVHVVGAEYLKDLKAGGERLFRMKNLPFDLKVDGYSVNTAGVAVDYETPPAGAAVVDGFFLKPIPPDKEAAERNRAGCRVQVLAKDGSLIQEHLLSSAAVYPAITEVDGKTYTLKHRKELWKMPFDIQLDKFTHEFHPGTMRPRKFESEIRRIEGANEKGERTEEPVLIRMNHPMRYEGYTFFQTNWGPQDGRKHNKYYSVLEVVKNPADHWPLYALIITGTGLLIHFCMKLFGFSQGQSRKRKKEA